MINKTNINQNKLILSLDKIFAFSINPQTNKKEITINPKLTENLLDEISDETRKLVVELYTTCEEDFIKGLELFEAIVQTKIMDVSQNQIKNLEKTIESVHSQTPGGPTMDPIKETNNNKINFPN